MDYSAGAMLLVDKPLRWTSFDVVNKLRNVLKRKYGKIKVGHAGTLDPLATGLLIICTGRMTKQIDDYQAQEKEYTGSFYLGGTTLTLDSEQPIDKEYPTAHITADLILATTHQFLGAIDQMPPQYSALKVNGVTAYEAARKGIEVALSPRQITISEFEITKIEMPEIYFRVVCSKGTYIRSLARDFGTALGSGAYLSSLIRTRIGNYHLRDAWELQALGKELEL